jgi:DNA-binding transcriptional LysR family regulator
MTLNQLRYFQAVCKYQNITKASEELFVSQPAISFAIKELEEELHVSLLSRSNNKISITPEGEIFLRDSAPILEEADNLVNKMQDISRSRNMIRLGMPPMIGALIFPTLYRDFKKEYPKVNIRVSEFGSSQTIQQIADNELDVAIAIMEGITNEKVETVPLFETELVFAVPQNSTLAKRKTIAFENLKDYPIVLMKAGAYQNKLILQKFKDKNIDPNVVLFSNQLNTIASFIAENACGGFLLKPIVSSLPNLVGIPLKDPVKLTIGLIYKKDVELFQDTKNFVEFVSSYKFSIQ